MNLLVQIGDLSKRVGAYSGTATANLTRRYPCE